MATNNTSTPQFQVDIGAIYAQWSQPCNQIHKVPPQLRIKAEQSGSSVYDPILVSLGPYHHGKPELLRAEQFKYICLDWCARGSEANKDRFYKCILSKIDEIRNCYAEVSIVNKYDDAALALMMLLDACFILSFMETRIGKTANSEWRRFLGLSVFSFAARDFMLLENQIPFSVQKMLINEMYDSVKSEELIQKLFCFFLEPDEQDQQVLIPRVNEHPPTHYLEAYRRLRVEKSTALPGLQENMQHSISFSQDPGKTLKKYYALRSVTDLNAKGIFFRPSSTDLYTDIKFQSRSFHGILHLPVYKVSEETPVELSNMIAYELSPDCQEDAVVLSYVNFMKSLIQTPADVKELQERGILLLHRNANIEQVVDSFKSIDTFGLSDNNNIYEDLMHRIGKHCNYTTKTWTAEMLYGDQAPFRDPWNVFAAYTTIILTVLAFLQTWYTVHPARG